MSQAFDARLLLEHAEFLRALARSLVGDAALADDVVQETFAVALERPPAPGNLRAWLATVAKSIAFGQRRTAVRRQRRERAVARAEPVASVAETAARLDVQKRLIHAVGDLEEPLRSTVVARFYDQLSFEEIAARDGVSVKTVSRRLDAALERLRGRFDAEHGGNRGAWTTLLLPLVHRRGRVAGAPVSAWVWLRLASRSWTSAAILLCMAIAGIVALLAFTPETSSRRSVATASPAESALIDSPAPVDLSPAAGRLAVRAVGYVDHRPLAGVPLELVRNGKAVTRVETDGRGLAALNAEPGDVIRAASAEFFPASRKVELATGEVELELQPAMCLHGRVLLAETGGSAIGASVSNGGPTVISVDDGGRFELAVPTDRTFMLKAWAPGCEAAHFVMLRTETGVREVALAHGAAALAEVLKMVGPNEIEITLGRGATVEGVVVDEAGLPASGAEVIVFDETYAGCRWYEGPRPAMWTGSAVRTDPRGKFTWRGLGPGIYAVVAHMDGLAGQSRTEVGSAGSAGAIEVRLSPSCQLAVRAVDNGKAAAIAEIRAVSGQTVVRWQVPPTDSIQPVLALPVCGKYEVEVETTDGRCGSDVVDADAPGRHDLVVFLDAGCTLEGIVKDRSDRPLPRVDVSASAGSCRGQCRTDDSGRFTISGMPASSATVCAGALTPGWRQSLKTDVRPGAPLEIRLDPSSRARLHVNPPVARAWVSAPTLVHRVSEGVFELEFKGVEPPQVVELEFSGYTSLRVEVPKLENGETRDLGEFVLNAGLELAGVVRDGEGIGIPSARVEGGGGMTTFTDSRGRFRLRALTGTEVAMQISARGFCSLSRVVQLPSAADVAFTLEPAGLVFVHVYEADGTGVFFLQDRVSASLVPLDREGKEQTGARIALRDMNDTQEHDSFPTFNGSLPLGRYRLQYALMDETGGESTRLVGPDLELTSPGQRVDIVLRLPP